MGEWNGILLAVVLLALNAFFVAAEFALISARMSQIEPRAEAGSKRAVITMRAMEKVSQVMVAAQLGITVCSLGLGAVAEPAIAHLLEPVFETLRVPEVAVHPVAFVVAMTIVVYLHVVLGEMVPKNIALAGPEQSALVLGPPMVGLVWLFKPLIVLLNAVANVTLRLLHVEPKDEVSSVFTRDEVAALVEESRGEGLIEAGEYDRLAGALGFVEKQVLEVLMPRADLTTVPRGATVAEVEAQCAATGYSRFPVADRSGDLVGFLHIKDVLEQESDKRDRQISDKWIRPFATVQPHDLLHEALHIMQRRGAHMAQVVWPDGQVRGVVTLEDVLEELVGEIRDAVHQHESGT